MHEHDQDLIMALAEGTLDEAAAAAARAEIGACAECSRDLELQRTAIAALDELPAVYLTAAESARLHDALKRDLDLVKAKTAPRRPGIAWGRWIPIVGVAVVLLAVVLSLPNMMGGDNSSADMTVAAAETTTTTASLSAEAQAPRDGATTTAAAGSAYDSASNAGGTETTAAAETTQAMAETTTTAAAQETTTEAMQEAELLPYLGNVADLDRDELLERVVAHMDDLRALSLEARRNDGGLNECLSTAVSEFDPTLGIPADGEPIAMGLVTDPAGDDLVLVAYVPSDVDQTVFVTLRSSDCQLKAALFQ